MEKSLLIRFMGDNPAARIVDFLVENKNMDYSKKEIASGAGISRASLFKHWGKMEDFELVKETRRFGKARLYTLNSESKIAEEILRLESALIKKAMEAARHEESEKQGAIA